MMELQQDKRFQRTILRLAQPVKNSMGQVLDIILPPRCAFSGDVVARDGEITPEVWKELDFITDPQCVKCGYPFEFKMDANMECPACIKMPPLFSQARAALTYDDHSRNLVLRFKHADQIHTVNTFLPWMMRVGENLIEQADIILPVPLHRWRLMRRRYNQAALIAKRLSEKIEKPWAYDLLLRARHTPTQGHLRAKDRKANVKGAFIVPENKRAFLDAKSILLIDDVYTTGATVNECAKALLSAGALEVNVLCIARVVKH